MKFKFSLERVLRARKISVDLAQKDFNEAMSFFNNQQDRLVDMQNLKTQNEYERAQIVSTEIEWSRKIFQINEFLAGQDYRIAEQIKRLKEIEKLVQSRREILLKALTEAKMIEKIKEKKLKDYVTEMTQKEQKEIDEIVSAKGNKSAYIDDAEIEEN